MLSGTPKTKYRNCKYVSYLLESNNKEIHAIDAIQDGLASGNIYDVGNSLGAIFAKILDAQF
jgi:hypothetical protein